MSARGIPPGPGRGPLGFRPRRHSAQSAVSRTKGLVFRVCPRDQLVQRIPIEDPCPRVRIYHLGLEAAQVVCRGRDGANSISNFVQVTEHVIPYKVVALDGGSLTCRNRPITSLI